MSRHAYTRAAMGDLITGVRVPTAALGFARLKTIQGVGFIGSHLFFFADFGVAVDMGFAFSLLNVPLMDTLKEVPVAIIPLFGVPVTGALSLMMPHSLLAQGA